MTRQTTTPAMPRHRRIALGVSRFVLDYLVALPLGCVVAVAWANTLPESYFRFAHAAAFPVNAIGMAFFFALITKEVTEATLPGGPLHPWRRAALPVTAAIGGAAASVGAYLAFLEYVEEPLLSTGWIAACAIDIPASYVVARLIFGRHAAVPFLLLLALFTDALGLGAIAVLQPLDGAHVAAGVGLAAAALGGAGALSYFQVANFWWYLIGPGVLSWAGLFLIGLHPALALVPIVPFLPRGARDPGLLVETPAQAHDPLTLFERGFRVPVEVVLFFFALVNAGVPVRGLEAGTWAVPVAGLGRVLGIVVTVGLAVAAGLHPPRQVGWKETVVVAATASIGFAFALFLATAIMPPGPVLLELKMGALLTVGGVVLALAAAATLGVGRFAPRHRSEE